MPILALFGIENSGLNTAVNLLVLFLAVLWLALVFYTYKDAVRRVGDSLLVGCATVTSLIFPFIGTIVYLILRPPEYLEDVRERELEIAAAEARLLQMHELACPYCSFPVERTFLRCPNCLKRLKEPCATCRKPLDPRWNICPYCEAEVQAGAQPAQAGRRRRRPAGQEREGPQTGAPAARPSGQERERPQPVSGAARQPAQGRVPAAPAATRSQQRPPDGSGERPADPAAAARPADAPRRQQPAEPARQPRQATPAPRDGESPGPGDQPTAARPGTSSQ